MADDQIGLQAVMKNEEWVRGFNQYMADLSKAAKETGDVAKSISDSWDKVAASMGKMGGGTGASSSFTGIGSAAGAASIGVGAMSASMFVANAAFAAVQGAANIAVGAFNNITSAMGDMLSTGVETVGKFQQVQVALESLAAKELVQSGAADNVNQALKQTGPIAQEAMAQLKQLSLQSPFQYEDIVNTFRINTALGQTMETSMDLTGAIMNMVAAGGLSGEFAQRIAYNFSQMSLTGQVTMRDLRDLAQAGVDLAGVFRTELGMSIEDVQKNLENGSLTMQQVTDAFVSYADNNFAGASQRMSMTLMGLKSSFADLLTFASMDLLGPSMEAIAIPLGQLFENARTLLDSGVLQKIGVALSVVTEETMKIGQAAAVAGQSFVDQFGGTMMQAASDAWTYGINISTELAGGIIEGASYAIAQAMDYISGMLGFWLEPGSPPRVAPGLVEWGASAMSEFLGGFSEADFGVLDNLQNPLKSALSTLVNIGSLDKDMSNKLFVSLSEQMANVIATGNGADAMFQNISDAAGQFGGELAKLAKTQIELAQASKAVEDIETRIAGLREKEKGADAGVMQKLKEYNDLLAMGAGGEQLAAKRAELTAAQALSDQAKNERIENEKNLEATQANISKLESQSKLQEKIVNQALDYADATKQTIDVQDQVNEKALGISMPKTALDKAKAAAKKSGGSGGVKKKTTTPTAKNPMQAWLDQMEQTMLAAEGIAEKSTLKEKLAEMFKPVTEMWDQKVSPAIERVKDSFSKLQEKMQPIIDKIIELTTKFTEMLPPTLLGNIGEVTGAIVGLGVIALIAATGIAILTTAIFEIGAAIASPILWLALLKTAWEEDWGGIQTKITDVSDVIKGKVDTTLIPALKDIKSFMDDHVNPAFESFSGLLKAIADKAFEGLSAAWLRIKPTLEEAEKWIKENLIKRFEDLKTSIFNADDQTNIFKGTIDILKTAISEFGKFFDDAKLGFDNWKKSVEEFKLPWALTPGSPTPFELGLRGIYDAFTSLSTIGASGITGLITQFTGIGDIFTNLTLSIENFKTTMYGLPELMAYITEGFGLFLQNITLLNDAFVTFNEIMTVFTQTLALLTEGLYVLQEIYAYFYDSLYSLFNEVLVGMNDFLLNVFMPTLVLFKAQLDMFYQTTLLTLYNYFTTMLVPVLEQTYQYIKKHFPEAIAALNIIIRTQLIAALQEARDAIGYFKAGVVEATYAVDNMTASVRNLIAALSELGGMDFGNLQPGSPTPFEIGLRGASDAIREMSALALPSLKRELNSTISSFTPATTNSYSFEPQIIVIPPEPPTVNAPTRNFNYYGGSGDGTDFFSQAYKYDMLYG